MIRDYNAIPNRFTLRLLLDGKPIQYKTKHSTRTVERFFDSIFTEPQEVRLDKHGQICKSDKYVFQNSWESETLGEVLVDTFSSILRYHTENTINYQYALSKRKNVDVNENLPSFKNKNYTIVIIDNKSINRDENGVKVLPSKLLHTYDKLLSKLDNGIISDTEMAQLALYENKIQNNSRKKVIFKKAFDASFYIQGGNVSHTLASIWKDFNCNLNSIRKGMSVEYDKVYNFSKIKSEYSEVQDLLKVAKIELASAIKNHKNFEAKNLSQEVKSLERDLQYLNTIFFRGIRSTIKYYLSKAHFSNKYTQKRIKRNNSNLFSNNREIIEDNSIDYSIN